LHSVAVLAVDSPNKVVMADQAEAVHLMVIRLRIEGVLDLTFKELLVVKALKAQT
jgi:hypothetical protein